MGPRAIRGQRAVTVEARDDSPLIATSRLCVVVHGFRLGCGKRFKCFAMSDIPKALAALHS
jgi:hypothetical protein